MCECCVGRTIRVGPPRVDISATGMGTLNVIDPVGVDWTLNVATCDDDDCENCDNKPVYLLMVEIELTLEEYQRLNSLSGCWTDNDQDCTDGTVTTAD